ncbi:MAG: hypothetical protein MI806_25960 [Minwuiales bacterium]|nr:hypothetical protein [Minwuiales bacterium]
MEQPRKSDLVDLDLTILRDTDLAWHVSDGVTETWLPKSVVEVDGFRGAFPCECLVTMPESWAEKKGLI